MKKIIICRHAVETRTGGVKQTQALELANQLKSHVAGLRTCLVSSTAYRARETLRIIAAELEITDIGFDEALGSENLSLNKEKTASLLDSKSQYDAIVLVSHEGAERFAFKYVTLVPPLLHGEAVVIDLESKLTYLPQK